jgi:ADP-ribose pyrophosphatase YjhB (NUDIX family)
MSFPCPRCGRPLTRTPREGEPGERQIRCPHCRYRMFDYPRPCAGMVVLKRESVLMLRRGHLPRRGWLDFPGGFLEAGEDPEQAARRELREETGLEVGRARWLGLYWDRYFLRGFGYFPTMSFYYIARWRRGEPAAADDAAAAEWIARAELRRHAPRFAWRHMATVVRDVLRLTRRGGR